METAIGRALFACLSVILLTACMPATSQPTAVAADESPTPATATPSPTPSPTPDVAAMGEMYLSAVADANEIGCEAEAMILGAAPDDLEIIKEAWALYASSSRQLADDLREMEFSAEIQPLIDELIVRLAANEAAQLTMAGATSLADVDSRIGPAREANDAARAQSNLIRGTLGLNSVPTACR